MTTAEIVRKRFGLFVSLWVISLVVGAFVPVLEIRKPAIAFWLPVWYAYPTFVQGLFQPLHGAVMGRC